MIHSAHLQCNSIILKEDLRKRRENKEEIREKRKEVFNKLKGAKTEKYQLEHLHGQPNYESDNLKSILKVKTAAEQFKEENKTTDVLMSQNAMKEILSELSFLRNKVESMEKIEETKVSGGREKNKKTKSGKKKDNSTPRTDKEFSKKEVVPEASQESSMSKSYGHEFEKSLEESKDSRKEHKHKKKSKKDEKKKKGHKKSKSRDRLDTKESKESKEESFQEKPNFIKSKNFIIREPGTILF